MPWQPVRQAGCSWCEGGVRHGGQGGEGARPGDGGGGPGHGEVGAASPSLGQPHGHLTARRILRKLLLRVEEPSGSLSRCGTTSAGGHSSAGLLSGNSLSIPYSSSYLLKKNWSFILRKTFSRAFPSFFEWGSSFHAHGYTHQHWRENSDMTSPKSPLDTQLII